MSDKMKTSMTEAGKVMSSAASSAASTAAASAQHMGQAAQDMGRTMMEKSMAGMSEFTKLFQDMKMPGIGGMDQFLAAQRRNMEVLSAANKVALEGAQAVARRHMEIMQQTMAEMTENMRQMASPEGPQERAARQAEMLKAAYERAVAHMRELADLIQRANSEAVELLNQRFAEALEEVKKLAAQSSGSMGMR